MSFDDDQKLIKAAETGNTAEIRNLLDVHPIWKWLGLSVDINGENETGMTPLRAAVANGHLETAEALIDAGAKIDAFGGPNCFMAIHLAVIHGRDDIVSMLLKKGANPCSEAALRITALHLAVSEGRISIAKTLLDAGAEINFPDMFGHTPMHFAAQLGNGEMMAFLLERGATTGHHTTFECSPLGSTVRNGQCDLARMLLDAGAKADESADNEGNTPLHLAAMDHDAEMVKLLLSFGAKADIMNQHEQTAVDVWPELAKLLPKPGEEPRPPPDPAPRHPHPKAPVSPKP